jgi:hypothetical protein
VVGGVGPVSLMVGEFEKITNQHPARMKRTMADSYSNGDDPVESLDCCKKRALAKRLLYKDTTRPIFLPKSLFTQVSPSPTSSVMTAHSTVHPLPSHPLKPLNLHKCFGTSNSLVSAFATNSRIHPSHLPLVRAYY